MKVVFISFAAGILASGIAYVLLGLGKEKSSPNEKTMTSVERKKIKAKPDSDETVEAQQQYVEQDRLIPQREWTGGPK